MKSAMNGLWLKDDRLNTYLGEDEAATDLILILECTAEVYAIEASK